MSKSPDQSSPYKGATYSDMNAETRVIRRENMSTSDEDGREIDQVLQREPESNFENIGRAQRTLAYLLFFTLGSSFLLPWNSLLVSTTYFGSRLRGNQFEFNYMNWITVAFTLSNVLFLYRAIFSQPNSQAVFRIFASLFLITFLTIVLLISTTYGKFDPNLFFGFVILITLGEAYGSAYLQTSVIGLSSWFGTNYLQAIFSGQGAIAAFVSVLQLLANINELGASNGPSNPEDTAKQIRQSSFTFYTACTAFCIFSLISFFVLLRLPIYEIAMQRKYLSVKSHNLNDQSDEAPLLSSIDRLPDGLSHPIPVRSGPQIRVIEPKIRFLGLTIFYNFFITLSVFPSLTGFILSANDPYKTHISASFPSNGDSFLQNWFKPTIFISIHFVLFNLGDWLGRALPQILTKFSHKLVKLKHVLYIISISRTCFIPLLVVCNVDHSSIVLFKSDLIYLLILTCFAISNGYLSTLVMIAGIMEPSLEPHEVDLASTCLSFYLTLGLAAGSLVSFGIKAIVLS